MRPFLAVVVLLAACRSSAPAPRAPANAQLAAASAPACEPRFLGQRFAEAASVDATATDVYWLDYNFGTLEHRPRRGGTIETLAAWDDEQLAESMRVAGDHIYWTSKGERGLFRIAISGGRPERLAGSDRLLGDVEVVGDTAYAATLDGGLLWWRGGATGVVEIGDGKVSLAVGGDVLYIGGPAGVSRVASPGARPEPVVTTNAPVEEVAVTRTMLYWIERRERTLLLRRRPLSGGEPADAATTGDDASVVLRGAPDGVYVAASNLVYFMGDTADEVLPVAIAPTDIADLDVDGDAVFVATTAGSIHELCPDRTRAIAIADVDAEPLDCPAGYDLEELGSRDVCVSPTGAWDGPTREWYASGTLHRRRAGDVVEELYADGKPMRVSVTRAGVAQTRLYYANGVLASTSEVRPDGTSKSQRFGLDGKPVN